MAVRRVMTYDSEFGCVAGMWRFTAWGSLGPPCKSQSRRGRGIAVPRTKSGSYRTNNTHSVPEEVSIMTRPLSLDTFDERLVSRES
jgi:hypothetical protein